MYYPWDDEETPPTKLKEERLAGVVEQLAGTKDGLYFLRWLLDECGAIKAEYPADHIRAAYREGKREIGVRLVMLAQNAGVAGKLFEEKE